MSILEEISATVEIKMNKYCNIELSEGMKDKLIKILISEAISETLFSMATMRDAI